MEASIVDLRYHMNDVMRALDRNETVTVLHRGKLRGHLVPAGPGQPRQKVAQHAFFGSAVDHSKSVDAVMDELRAPRYE